LPQRNHKQLMLRAGVARATALKRLTQLWIFRKASMRSGRAACAHAR
jgi:hypothetical protein